MKKIKLRTLKTLLACYAMAVFSTGGVAGLRWLGLLEQLELAAYDRFLNQRHNSVRGPAPIVVVGLTEADIQTMGQYPVSDFDLATALRNILDHDPAAVAIDIFRDIQVPRVDGVMGRAELDQLLQDPRVVPMGFFGRKYPAWAVPPPPAVSGDDRVGFSDVVMDRDGVVRRCLLALSPEERFCTSLGLQCALRYLQRQDIYPQVEDETTNATRLGRAVLKPLALNAGGYATADMAGFQILCDFRRSVHTVPQLKLMDVIHGRVPASLLRGRIVMIGLMADSVRDELLVPISDSRYDPPQQRYGVILHALVADQLIRLAQGVARPTSTWSKTFELFWIGSWALSATSLVLLLQKPSLFVCSMLLCLGGIIGISYRMFLLDVWVPIVPAILTLVGAGVGAQLVRWYVDRADRAAMMQLFQSLVADEVADMIWDRRDEIFRDGRLRSEQLEVTVLFTDVVGFSSIAERYPPEQLVAWMNDYIQVISQAVIDHGGVINKYIGDAVMALFGAPVAAKTDQEQRALAIAAVRSALAMRTVLQGFNQRWDRQGLPPLQMRVGIHTGSVVAGSIGSARRQEYTVVGNTVNLASRLESFGKDRFDQGIAPGGCRICVTQATLDLLGATFESLSLGRVRMHNLAVPVQVHAVLAEHCQPGATDKPHSAKGARKGRPVKEGI